MPRKKVNGDENLKEKVSLVEEGKINNEKKGRKEERKNIGSISKENRKSKSVEIKSLPKAEEKKSLPKAKSNKLLGSNLKKALPKSEKTKSLPLGKKNKMLPKLKVKKELPKPLTREEKDLRLLEKIKEFFSNNPDKLSILDDNVEKNSDFIPEYYDLPYRYNETVVKILAQTPKRLFIYWDISDKDIEKYRKAFGEDFFERTYPVLLVHNEELNYTYEVPINDFANSWYLDIKDSKCKYSVQLGRKFKEYPKITEKEQKIVNEENIILKNDYIEIVNSNVLEAPNDHVLFESLKPIITYRNVKTFKETKVEVRNIISSFAKIYNVYDLYKVIYKNEINNAMFDLNNPSSAGNPSSSISSSWFK